MFQTFIRIDGDMYKIGLSADEMIILAKIMEFHYQTGKTFVSNESFAEISHCSISTVDRRIKHLEQLGLIKRDTKVTHNGKDRKMYFNESKYLELVSSQQEESANDKLSLAETTNCHSQTTNCHLRIRQDGLIKDNIKDNIEKIKEKDNSCAPQM